MRSNGGTVDVQQAEQVVVVDGRRFGFVQGEWLQERGGRWWSVPTDARDDLLARSLTALAERDVRIAALESALDDCWTALRERQPPPAG